MSNTYKAIGLMNEDGTVSVYGTTKSGGGGGGVSVVSATLLSNDWNNSSQTVTISGMTSNTSGEVGLPSSTTSSQRTAARSAMLAPTAQGINTLTITADGTVPSIDIPIEVVMY